MSEEVTNTGGEGPSLVNRLIVSAILMLPWPAMAAGVCLSRSMFDENSEAILMFGGVTLLFLLPLAILGAAEWVFGILIGIVWLSVFFLPHWLAKRGWKACDNLAFVFVAQTAFSVVQAALGALMVLAKGV